MAELISVTLHLFQRWIDARQIKTSFCISQSYENKSDTYFNKSILAGAEIAFMAAVR
jgi:hypothetical protein